VKSNDIPLKDDVKNYILEKVVSDIQIPWGMVWFPDGSKKYSVPIFLWTFFLSECQSKPQRGQKGTFKGFGIQTLSEDGRQFEEINNVQLLEVSVEKQAQLDYMIKYNSSFPMKNTLVY